MRSETWNPGERPHRPRPRRFLGTALLVLTVFAGVSISGDSGEVDTTAPTLSLPESVQWGGTLYGIGLDRNAPILVTATTHNGTALGGSPDSSSGPGSNNFCLTMPQGSGLGWVKVTATDPEGNTRVAFVPIR